MKTYPQDIRCFTYKRGKSKMIGKFIKKKKIQIPIATGQKLFTVYIAPMKTVIFLLLNSKKVLPNTGLA